jgi:hypothetical protein
MVKMTAYEVVLVIAVRNRLMTAARAVLVLLVVATTIVAGLRRCGMLGVDCNHVLISMICVGVVQVAIMKIVSMPFVLDSRVPARGPVLMRVFFVDATCFCHKFLLRSIVLGGLDLLVEPMRCHCDSLLRRPFFLCVSCTPKAGITHLLLLDGCSVSQKAGLRRSGRSSAAKSEEESTMERRSPLQRSAMDGSYAC